MPPMRDLHMTRRTFRHVCARGVRAGRISARHATRPGQSAPCAASRIPRTHCRDTAARACGLKGLPVRVARARSLRHGLFPPEHRPRQMVSQRPSHPPLFHDFSIAREGAVVTGLLREAQPTAHAIVEQDSLCDATPGRRLLFALDLVRRFVSHLHAAFLAPPLTKDGDLVLVMLPFTLRKGIEQEPYVAFPRRVGLWQRNPAVSEDVAALAGIQRAVARARDTGDDASPCVRFDDVPHRKTAPLVIAVGLADSLLMDREPSLIHEVIESVVRQFSATVKGPDIFGAPVVDWVNIEQRAAFPRGVAPIFQTRLARARDGAPTVEALGAADSHEACRRDIICARIPVPELLDELLELHCGSFAILARMGLLIEWIARVVRDGMRS